VLEFEYGSGSDCLADGRRHARLIVGVDIFLKPGFARRIRIRDKILPLKKAHLAPIRTHLIHHIGTGRYQGPEAFLALTELLLRSLAFTDVSNQ